MIEFDNTPDSFFDDNKGTENNPFKKIHGIKKEPDYKTILNNALIRIDDNIPLPPVCIEIILNGIAHTFGTLGDFSMLIGKAKAGKSFALSLIIAASLKDGIALQNVIRATLPEDKKAVLYFDTEQSKFYVYKALKRICAISNVPEPKNLMVYSLRQYSPAERLEIIDYAINNNENLGLVVIDGIKDLISSINDEEQASMIASKLLKWTEQKNIHIITVLHQNKTDNNARGHIGTELINKSQLTISITKSEDKALSIIETEFCRDKDFEPIAFSIDIDGLPHIIDDYIQTISTNKEKKKLAPHEVSRESHAMILKDIFSLEDEMIRSDLKRTAKATISRYLSNDIGQNKTDDWITHWLHFKYIVSNGTPNTKACKYSINYNNNNK